MKKPALVALFVAVFAAVLGVILAPLWNNFWEEKMPAIGAPLVALIGILILAGIAAFGLAVLHYFDVLGAAVAPVGTVKRTDCDALRQRIASANGVARDYARWLEVFLDAIDRFFGDAELADRTWFPHAFGLRKAAPLWTAPSFDRSLLLALFYLIAAIVITWAVGNHVGPAEAALGLHATDDWRRAATLVAIGFLAFAVRRAAHVSGRPFFAWLIVAFAFAAAAAVAVAGASVGDVAVALAFAVVFAVAFPIIGVVAAFVAYVFCIAFLTVTLAVARAGARPDAGAFAVTCAVAGAGAVAFAFAGSGGGVGVAFAVAYAVAFAAVVAVALLAGAVAGVVAFAVAVAGAFAGAFAAAIAVAGTGAVAFAVAFAVTFAVAFAFGVVAAKADDGAPVGAVAVVGSIAVAVAGAAGFAFAFVGVVDFAVTLAIAVAIAFAVGVAVTDGGSGEIAVTVAVAAMVALAGASTAAGTGAVALAIAVVGAFVVVFARANSKVAGWQRIVPSVVLIVIFLVCFADAALLSRLDKWRAFGPSLLFLGPLALITGTFDWLSLGLTRALMRRGLERETWWLYLYAFVDALLAPAVVAFLAMAMVAGVQAFDDLAVYGGGMPAFPPMREFLDAIKADPGKPEYWWVYATLFSTMLPSLINLFIAGVSLARGVPGISSWLLGKVREGEAAPAYDRLLVAIVLALQGVAGLAIALVAQGFLFWVVIWQGLPRLGIGVLDLAHFIAH